MSDWWQSRAMIEQIFLIFAVPSTFILILQTILLLIGLGGGGGADADLDSDVSGIGDGDFSVDSAELDLGDVADDVSDNNVDAGFRIFTVRGFITFFTLFGWTGLVCFQAGMPNAVCVTMGVTVGMAGMALTAYILKAVLNLQSDGSLNLVNAVGKTATVYIRVPGKRADRGKVNVVIQERLIEACAVTDEDVDIASGSEVVVVGMSSIDTLLVAPKNPKSISISNRQQ